MHKYFNQTQTQQHIFLLYGVGGAGKTQIALKFIEESSCFSDIFVIDASTQDTIDAGLKNIAVIKAGSTSQDALNWLKGKKDQWLLLFDNADDPEIDLHSFFPQCAHGNIIITSRNPGLRVYAGLYAQVSDMEETDAIKLLLRSAVQEVTPRNEEMAAEIVQELVYLPLAISQAGAFIAKSGALNTYLELYKQNKVQLLSKKPAQSHDDYPWTVYTTWQISFDKLSEPAQTLLQLCSFLHYRGISERIFSKASACGAICASLQGLQKPMEFLSWYLGPTGDWDSLRFTEVTNQLRAYSLIDFNADTRLFSIHPLVHSWSQSTLKDEEVYHYSMITIVGMAITPLRLRDLQRESLWLLPHIDSLCKGQTHIPPDFNVYYSAIYFYAGRHKESAELDLVNFEEQRESLGKDHPATLHAMGELAYTYHKLGRLNEAEEIAGIVLHRLKETLGEDHPYTLFAMANLGAIYSQQGQLHKAEELESVLLQKGKEIFGEDHPDTLLAMGDLAWTYSKLGQLNRAEELEVVVLKKQKGILGEDHPDTLLAMANLGSTYSQQGQLYKAEELESVVLQKRKEILGEDHPDTLLAMGELAWTYRKLGQLNRAEELEIVVLKKRKEILGEDHPDTLHTMGSLGATYNQQGQLHKAEELESVVLQKRKEILGEDHPDTLLAMGNLAWTHHKLSQLNKAEELEVVVLEKLRIVLKFVAAFLGVPV
ncbi:P-loop containing nucleoside triphosphate hydrolase protein [Mycena metata]|uniref:P-loop containing nucleoside triphosphate hydrolase protein n=1 Tax=Mycena metata TaxID=1033252 RepID=A0AAD7HB43_9AGAR|nr:P-loop containing nucleoside triphosphate hydrolase protein [Mycena metata]